MKKIILSGVLGQDSKFTANENPKHSVLRFSVGCRDWDRKTKTNMTDWIDCTLFGDRASKDQTILLKGTHVVVCGNLQKPEVWTDQKGVQRCNSKVIVDSWEFSGPKATDAPAPAPAPAATTAAEEEPPF